MDIKTEEHVSNNTSWIVGLYSDRSAQQSPDADGPRYWLDATNETTDHLPFAAMSINPMEDRDVVAAHADVGCYIVNERTIKNEALALLDVQSLPGVVGINAMVPNAELGARAADNYWRDSHAPLALKIHKVMTHYYQLSVREVLSGPAYAGIALCCCATGHDLRERFFDSKEGRNAILEDIQVFSDTRRSPRRVVANMAKTNA